MNEHKRAQAATGLVMAFGGITILILTVILLVVVQDHGAKGHANDIINGVDNSITLLNYLRTPVDNKHNMAELMAEYRMTKSAELKDDIATRSTQILDNIFGGDYAIIIKLDNEDIVKIKDACRQGGAASQEIMLFDGNKAKVELICG